jgi:rhodanese-related sulfurtransferase
MALQQNLEPADVTRWLAERAIVLIDVREPDEFASEHIHGALLYPLSTFDPQALPAPGDRKIVLQCGSGMRSAKALTICADAGVAVAGHVAGGIKAWKAAGLPVISTDPDTGKLREQR